MNSELSSWLSANGYPHNSAVAIAVAQLLAGPYETEKCGSNVFNEDFCIAAALIEQRNSEIRLIESQRLFEEQQHKYREDL